MMHGHTYIKLQLDVDPHICTPQVQIGFRIALYTSSLFSSDRA